MEASELYRPSDRRLLVKLVPTFTGRECHVVSVTDPYGLNLGFLDRRFFLSSSSSVLVTRLSAPRSRLTTSQKMWWRRKSNPDLWIYSQELWPLDHRGGLILPEMLVPPNFDCISVTYYSTTFGPVSWRNNLSNSEKALWMLLTFTCPLSGLLLRLHSNANGGEGDA
jgi:hypothetical protein